MAKYKTIIGRYEYLELKDFLCAEIPVKIDTGAYISSINADNIEVKEDKDGKKVLSCRLLAGHKAYPYSRDFTTSKFEIKTIENSFGHSEQRYMISLKVKIANKVFHTNFTLADRSTKTFPVLIGRSTLSGRFLVDTSLSTISKKKIEKDMPAALKEDTQGLK